MKKGYFPTTGGHKLYYELYGNPNGRPAVFFHGGPGGGFEEKHKRFFDPTIWNVLFFDQRGASKSTPFASTKNNTTQDLITDTKKLMAHVGFEKALLFGGSWGATLALCFAIQNTTLVNGMILFGPYLGTKADDAYYIGGGTKEYFPDIWENFLSLVPKEKQHDPLSYYLHQLQSEDAATREKFAYAWTYYESSLVRMQFSDKKIRKGLKEFPYVSLATLEAHYISNNCFLEDNYILDNIQKLADIPISITQGRYDFVIRPINAWKLHKALPKSNLAFVTGGHSSSEKEVEKNLLKEIKKFQEM